MTLARFTTPVATATAEDSVLEAARTMRDRHVGCLVVLREGRSAGVLTDRDLVVRVIAAGRDPSKTKVHDFVTYDPITVSVDDGIQTAADQMRRHGVRRLPLVDARGVVVGIVTADDLLVVLGSQLAAICEGIDNRSDADESR
jgi:CBS domain-containing protein